MQDGFRKVLIAQIGLVSATALAFFIWQGQTQALSAIFGGAIALVNSLLMVRSYRRGQAKEGNRVLVSMYAGSAQRFVTAAVGFAAGLALLKLAPLPMIAAFALAQIGYVVGAHQQQAQ